MSLEDNQALPSMSYSKPSYQTSQTVSSATQLYNQQVFINKHREQKGEGKGSDGQSKKAMVNLISPEKKYINQRLNIKMFYHEQISLTRPDQQTSITNEDDLKGAGISIRDIVMKQMMQGRQYNIKVNDDSIGEPYSEILNTTRKKTIVNLLGSKEDSEQYQSRINFVLDSKLNSIQVNNEDDQITLPNNGNALTSKNSMTVDKKNRFVKSQLDLNNKLQIESSPMSHHSPQKELKKSKQVNIYIQQGKRPVQIDQTVLQNSFRKEKSQSKKHNISADQLEQTSKINSQDYSSSKVVYLPQIHKNKYDSPSIDDLKNYHGQTSSASVMSKYILDSSPSLYPGIGGSYQSQKHKSKSFVTNARSVFRKNYEKITDPIIKNPYNQISSSFAVGNKDRFGDSYVPMKPLDNIPGPGSYQIPVAFDRKGSLTTYAQIEKYILKRSKLQNQSFDNRL